MDKATRNTILFMYLVTTLCAVVAYFTEAHGSTERQYKNQYFPVYHGDPEHYTGYND